MKVLTVLDALLNRDRLDKFDAAHDVLEAQHMEMILSMDGAVSLWVSKRWLKEDVDRSLFSDEGLDRYNRYNVPQASRKEFIAFDLNHLKIGPRAQGADVWVQVASGKPSKDAVYWHYRDNLWRELCYPQTNWGGTIEDFIRTYPLYGCVLEPRYN